MPRLHIRRIFVVKGVIGVGLFVTYFVPPAFQVIVGMSANALWLLWEEKS